MTEGPLQERLADLETALQDSPQGSLSLPKMEDLKAWLDDTRFKVWDQLQAAQKPEEPVFEDRFRVRRATELCQRLEADVREGRVDAGRPELSELQAAAAQLQQTIEARRAVSGG
jgi:hypothetical protein